VWKGRVVQRGSFRPTLSLLLLQLLLGLAHTLDATVNLLLESSQPGSSVQPPSGIGSTAHFVPLYPVTDKGPPRSVGFRWSVQPTAVIVAGLAQDGAVLWNISVAHDAGTNASVSGGWDFDSDGVPDLGIVYHAAVSPPATCGEP
jgi:hypothetical protein